MRSSVKLIKVRSSLHGKVVFMNNVVRLNKFIEVIGWITTIVGSSGVIVLCLAGIYGCAILMALFLLLGIVMLLLYKNQFMIVEEEGILFHYLIKKEKRVSYADIRCILILAMRNKYEIVLVDKQYQRIAAWEPAEINDACLYEAFEKNNIKIVDFNEMIEEGSGAENYFQALNIIEKNYFENRLTVKKAEVQMLKKKAGSSKKKKKYIRVVGWILIGCDVASFFIGGRPMLVIWIAVVLIAYAVYLIHYPYLYIDKDKESRLSKAYNTILAGGLISSFMMSMFAAQGNFAWLGTYMKITGCIAVVLMIPFVIKDMRTDVKQKLRRKLSVFGCVCLMAFVINYPLNMLLSFDNPAHETVTVTKKYESHTRRQWNYYLCVKQEDGTKREYEVSRSEYKETSVGDYKRLHIQTSALGLKYYLLHD